jgi:hypothetical protein
VSRLLPIASILLAASVSLVSTASAGDPPPAAAGRVYLKGDVQALTALVEGLGYASKPLGDAVSFRATRGDGFYAQMNLAVSKDGLKLQLFAPLEKWPLLDAVPSPRLSALLEKNLDIAPSRFYLLGAENSSAWVGLQRSVDNRAVRPMDVRQQIDTLLIHARVTQNLWDPARWAAEPPADTGGMR